MKIKNIAVQLRGLRDIMFCRYLGKTSTSCNPESLLYYAEDEKTLVLPALNLRSFLCAQNTDSCAKKFYDPRKFRNKALAIQSYCQIEPDLIPLTANGKPIVFDGFNEKIYLFRSVPRLPKGIPNEITRPVVRVPWELSFTLRLIENELISEMELYSLFEKGGIMIGLGTYRGVFGKFEIAKWERI
jgi:hypothetical protein